MTTTTVRKRKSKFNEFLKILAPTAIAAVMPESLVNSALAMGVKHRTRINNQAIPLLNLVASTGFSFVRNGMASGEWMGSIGTALAEGVALMGASTGFHQSLKIATGKKI